MVNHVPTLKFDSVVQNSMKLNAMRVIINNGQFGSIPMTLSIVVIGKTGTKCPRIWFAWNHLQSNIKLKAVEMVLTTVAHRLVQKFYRNALSQDIL